MPVNPLYYVDLFYEDVGFTNDYSNVLQFDSKENRETYFDNIDHYRMENTDFNNMNITGNTIKIAFYDLQSVDLDEINYLRIATRLYGTSTTLDTLEYGFVTDYSVISSIENCTVVAFTFEKDMWMNYQFNFNLKECNIDRCHCDRWNREGKIIFRVCEDLYNSVATVESKSDLIPNIKNRYHNAIQNADGHISGVATNADAKILWALMVVYVTQGDNPDRYVYTLFPITINPYEAEGNWGINYNIRNIRIPYSFNKNTSDIAFYPSLRDIENGNINQIVTSMFGSGTQIVNIQFLTDAPFRVKGVSDGTIIHNYVYYGDENYNNDNYMKIGLNVLNVSIPYLKNDLTTGTETASFEIIALNEDMVSAIGEGNYYADILEDIAFPRDGTSNEDYEPMLFKSPIRKRYLMTKDGSNHMEIPDNFINFVDKKINAKAYATLNPTSAGELISLVDALENSPGQFTSLLTAGLYSSVGFDGTVVNDTYMQYCINQRDTDRKMMIVNMATAGMADTGSTAISAGIGYRSNMERAEIAGLYSNISPNAMKQEQMYTKYAKQAVGMSVAGGFAQYGANALGSYMAQGAKEVGIKNTPGSIVSATSITAYINHTKDTTRWKEVVTVKCDDTTYDKYSNIFKKFGYYIGAVMTPNIKSRKYFDYIKTNGAILTGNVNQFILSRLAIIFDKGVTIWHMDNNNKNTLYDYTNENIERNLIPKLAEEINDYEVKTKLNGKTYIRGDSIQITMSPNSDIFVLKPNLEPEVDENWIAYTNDTDEEMDITITFDESGKWEINYDDLPDYTADIKVI